LGVGVASCLLAAVAAGLGLNLSPAGSLKAGPAGTSGGAEVDSDGDGLSDVLEQILKTNPLSADSDGDGYSDMLEYTLGSSPVQYASFPTSYDRSVRLFAHSAGGLMRLTQLVYLPGGEISTTDYRLYIHTQGETIPIDPNLFLAGATFTFHPHIPFDSMIAVTTTIPVWVMAKLGSASFFATVAEAATGGAGSGSKPILDAHGVNLVFADGILQEIVDAQEVGLGYLGSGSVYRPLQPAEEIGGTMFPGQLCFQLAALGGSAGSMLVYEVTSAECALADGYCSSLCQLKTGTEFEMFDPLALIGG